jgi:hypothetical protein
VHWHVYLRKGTVYLTTMGKMDKGFYRGVEPVAVVSVIDTKALREALAATVVRGNPRVPVLRRNEYPPPVLLKYAGVKHGRYLTATPHFGLLAKMVVAL